MTRSKSNSSGKALMKLKKGSNIFMKKKKKKMKKKNFNLQRQQQILEDEIFLSEKDEALKMMEEKVTNEQRLEILLSPDFWINYYIVVYSYNPGLIVGRRHFLRSFLPLIQRACNSIKNKTQGATSFNIVPVLHDPTARWFLFHLAYCISCLQSITSGIDQITHKLTSQAKIPKLDETAAVKDTKPDDDASSTLLQAGHVISSANVPELENGVKGESGLCSLIDRENNFLQNHTKILHGLQNFLLDVEDKLAKAPGQEGIKISTTISNIVLVLKEILANMGIQPEVCDHNKKDEPAAGNMCINCNSVKESVDRIESKEAVFCELVEKHFDSFLTRIEKGFVKRKFVDGQSAALMALVEAGVSQQKLEILRKARMLLRLCDNVFESYDPESDEHMVALGCKTELREVTEEHFSKLWKSVLCLTKSSEARTPLYVAFRKVIELIEPDQRMSVWYFD